VVHISAKRWAGIALGALAWVGAMAWGVEAQTYIAEPVLVTQPAYAGLSFYVYRPYNMPAGWFVTRDGNYPVIQDSGGVWVYGYTVEGGALVPSGYVVGSVDPRTLGNPPGPQPPFPAPAPQPRQPQRVAPPPPAPQPQPQFLPPPPPGVMVPQGCAGATVPMVSAPYVPSWALDKNFLEMSHWSRLVDRGAILHRPRTPVAWKGDNPTVLFAWTGRHWYAIRPARGNPGPGLGTPLVRPPDDDAPKRHGVERRRNSGVGESGVALGIPVAGECGASPGGGPPRGPFGEVRAKSLGGRGASRAGSRKED